MVQKLDVHRSVAAMLGNENPALAKLEGAGWYICADIVSVEFTEPLDSRMGFIARMLPRLYATSPSSSVVPNLLM